jgi:anti-anti-sigma regulatory factor
MSSATSTELLRSQEAMDLIASEKDPITRALLANANFWFFKRYFEQGSQPAGDLDYAFVIELLRDIFREHDVLRRLLAGEKVGEFFEDEPHEETFNVELVGSDPRVLILTGRLDVTSAPQLQSRVYDIMTVPHSFVAFNCERLTIINPWVIAIVWSFAEEMRESGIHVEVRGLDSAWQMYLEAFTQAHARRDSGHDSFVRNLLGTFTSLSAGHKRHE